LHYFRVKKFASPSIWEINHQSLIDNKRIEQKALFSLADADI
jgi:hypothetical protein